MLSLFLIGQTKGLCLAVFYTIILNHNDISKSFHPYNKEYENSNTNGNITNSSTTSSFFHSTIKRMLLLISGNVHPNPGPSPSSDFHVVHINCRSLTKEKKILIETESNKFDVITLSETWLKDKHTDQEMNIDGFHTIIRKDRPNNIGWGGVGIYVKNKHYCKRRPDLEVNNLEAVWIETKIDKKSFLIGSFYRPPNSRVEYWDLIAESIRKANSTNSTIIILGDFNTDFHKNIPVRFRDIINRFNLRQLINTSTRIAENTATCLDLILTQTTDFVSDIDVLPEICSDHACPLISVKTHVPDNNTFRRTYYDYNKLRVNDFVSLLSAIDWTRILENPVTDIDLCAEQFCNLFFSTALKCLPVNK